MSQLLTATEKLLASKPFDFSPENRRRFVESFREVAWRHFRGNAAFSHFWKTSGLTPDDIKTESDLMRAPFMMVHLFKEWELCSVPQDEVVLRLTSSGTGGQKSQMFLNQGSLDRVKRLAYDIHGELGLTSNDKVNYICFTYDPRVAKDLGTAFTDELLTSFTGVKSVYYTFQWDPGKEDFFFNEKGLIQRLEECQKDGAPVRLLGFPAFLYKLLKDHDLRFEFGPESWVQTGGGWKGLADEEIPKDQFRTFVSARLGLPKENVRDLFGMVEHGIPYVDCRLGRMHVPNYARVFIRSPFDLSVQPEGATGLIQFMCSYNDGYPAMNLLSTDWGRLGRCECGLEGQTLQITGRAGVNKHKGCAIHAAEALR